MARQRLAFARLRDGFEFDPDANEWYHICGACKTEIFAPYLNDLKYNFNKHIHSNDCLGGW